eukprot:CAMPEP_0202698620 /NCGR_PEP_ID=MMETSP1385-20130828/11884_1 /ASSEMBLY_ACC=CAM_ASM_000861 /TAXON_ID=933848 /ORGANISM="Elphidium margaritaceum" /LENGTH=263 /DNA_ID=CAMNT_0049355377 /DNA_START=450 /DNA_END=1241 /DNA_ORIENTATION=-
MTPGVNVLLIVICEIAWEVCIEFTSLWMLYLFIHKLYVLLKLTLMQQSIDSTPQSDIDLFADLKHSMAPKLELKNSMTVSSRSNSRSRSATVPVNTSQNSLTQEVIQLTNLMNKLSLLMVLTVFVSLFSIVGHLIVELPYLQTNENQTDDIHVQQMWAFLLPVVDMVSTSLLLYFQFGFTSKVYNKMCGCLDILFLKLCFAVHGRLLTATERSLPKVNTTVTKQSQHAQPQGKSHPTTCPDVELSASLPRQTVPNTNTDLVQI